MKLENQVERESNMKAADAALTISKEAVSYILGILTDLYEFPKRAAIREYICNAVDAHTAAGTTEPVQVALPTLMKPTFVVEDFGIGMSPDDVMNTFIQYGASTKRDTDTMIGGFGVGGKAGLSVSDQFTLTTTRDGVTSVVHFSRKEDGGGDIRILRQANVGANDGTIIEIPVKCTQADQDEWYREARYFVSWWSEDEVIIMNDDEEQPRITFDNPFVKDVYTIPSELAVMMTQQEADYRRRYNTSPAMAKPPTSIVTVGNVPYPVTSEAFTGDDLKEGDVIWPFGNADDVVVLTADVGDVDIAPNRESLRLSPKTKRWVAKRREETMAHVEAYIQKELAKVTSKAEVMDTYLAIRAKFNTGVKIPNVTWKGETLPAAPSFPAGATYVGTDTTGSLDRYSNLGGGISWRAVAQVLVIEEYENAGFSMDQRTKALAYFKEVAKLAEPFRDASLRGTGVYGTRDWQAERARGFILIPSGTTFDEEWWPPSRRAKWSAIKEWAKNNRIAQKKPSIAGYSLDFWVTTNGSRYTIRLSAADIQDMIDAKDKEVYWVERPPNMNRYRQEYWESALRSEVAKYARHVGGSPDVHVVHVPVNRLTTVPKKLGVQEWGARVADVERRWAAKLSDVQRLAISIRAYGLSSRAENLATALRCGGVADEGLAFLLQGARRARTIRTPVRDAERMTHLFDDPFDLIREAERQYPLLTYDREAMREYVNQTYRANHEA